MSAPTLSLAEVRELADKARERIAEEAACKRWADLYPIAEPFIERGGRRAIPDAVQFLIDEGAVNESQRRAAELAFRRERANRRKTFS